jgi:hypothetical protein
MFSITIHADGSAVDGRKKQNPRTRPGWFMFFNTIASVAILNSVNPYDSRTTTYGGLSIFIIMI